MWAAQVKGQIPGKGVICDASVTSTPQSWENECLGPKGVLGGPGIHYTSLLYHHYLASHSKFNLSGKAPLGFWLFPFPGESEERKVNRMNYNLDAAASLRPATDIRHLPSLLFILISLHQQYLH